MELAARRRRANLPAVHRATLATIAAIGPATWQHGSVRMTLDPTFNASDDRIRAALKDLREALVELGHTHKAYVESADHLLWSLDNDRAVFYRSVNGGGVWRNMGSIEDLGGRRIWQSLVRLARALEAAGLAGAVALQDAAILQEWLEKPMAPE
jgi:hypothetical protein